MRQTAHVLIPFAIALVVALPATLPAQRPAPDAWREAKEGTFALRELTLTRAIEDRQAKAAISGIPADGEQVYCHLVVFNKGAPRALTVSWMRDGRVAQSHHLAVGRSPAWRTWSSMRATPGARGVWTVQVSTEDGALLGAGTLQIGAQAPPVLDAPPPGSAENMSISASSWATMPSSARLASGRSNPPTHGYVC